MSDNTTFIRDTASNALINTKKAEYMEYKKMRNMSRKVTSMETDINNIKDDLQKITKLLNDLLKEVK